MKKMYLKGLSRQEMENFFLSIGEKRFRAQQLWTWIYIRDMDHFEEMSNISKALRKKLSRIATISRLKLAAKQLSEATGTQKFLWELEDGLHVESVFIPDKERRTVCISTQVGCALGCRICATGKLGFTRNLHSHEIVEQVMGVQRQIGQKMTNIVVMGMGEPFQNYDALLRALYILNDSDGIAIGYRKITISTAGLIPELQRYTAEGHPFQLALSLHATTDAQRNQIMPINKKYPLAELLAASRAYTQNSKSRLTIEYVLIDGVNDAPEDAHRLMKLLRGIPCKINLIAYNPTGNTFKRPTQARIDAFSDIICPLLSAPVTVRRSKGDDIDGACGQLAGKSKYNMNPDPAE